MLDFERFYSLLQILLTWPVLTFSFALFFCLRFRTEIGNAIMRFKGFRFGRAKAEFEGQAAPSTAPRSLEPITEEDMLEAIEELTKTGDENQNRAAERMRRVTEERKFWEFRYLDLFLQPYTKNTLTWLYRVGGANVEDIAQYANRWNVPDNEITAVFEALLYHFLTSKYVEAPRVTITAKGIQYLHHIHALPLPTEHK